MTQVVDDGHRGRYAISEHCPQQAPQGVWSGNVLCRLLDRTPSERSEDKLVFLINVRRTVVRRERKFLTSARTESAAEWDGH